MNILIVEDDASNRLLLRRILRSAGWNSTIANDGTEALNILEHEKFDVILSDWMMPKMDGLELVKRIRKKYVPAPVIIMVTALDSYEAREKAIEAGADDYIGKPFDKNRIISTIENWSNRHNAEFVPPAKFEKPKEIKKRPFVGVCIAASTGGPKTLIQILEKIQPTSKASFFIVLHAPTWMLESFSTRVKNLCKMPVHLAEHDMPIKAGEIYLAPGHRHLEIDSDKFTLVLSDAPPVNFVKPAADPLFKSVAKTFGANSLAMVLTGMGHDGAIGCGFIAAAGGFVIAQDPDTTVIPSMPQTVIKLGLADLVSSLDTIPHTLIRRANKIYDESTTIGK